MRWADAGSGALLDSEAHRAELEAESARLLGFFEGPDGVARFGWRDTDGDIDPRRPLALYGVARLVHCFGVAHLLGHPDAGGWAEDGVRLLLDRFADADAAGFVEAIGSGGAVIASERTAYGHAFALLAGATAGQAGIPGARDLQRRAMTAIDALLWRDDVGAAVDAVASSGRVLERYRGQNANMHLTEAFLAAYELDGNGEWLNRAQRLAERLVLRPLDRYDARVPEHYTADWQVDADYGRDTPLDPFRPFGTMPGHAVEWARLLLNIAAHTNDDGALLTASQRLYAGAIRDGRTQIGAGLAYTVDIDGSIVSDARMHWVAAEALSATVWLARTTGEPAYADHYSGFWKDITTHFVDSHGGSWWHELDAQNEPASTTWEGKPDLYHAYQAALMARLTRPSGVAAAARDGAIRFATPNSRTERDS